MKEKNEPDDIGKIIQKVLRRAQFGRELAPPVPSMPIWEQAMPVPYSPAPR